MQEIETKVLDINPLELREKLSNLGARLVSKGIMKRWVFDLTKGDGADEFIRLRQNHSNVTLTYKYRKGGGLANTEEIETVVNDFDATAIILSKALTDNYYQENYSEIYSLDGAEVCILIWPKIPVFLEVESTSEAKIKTILKKLGLKDVGNIGQHAVYKSYGIEQHSFRKLEFSDEEKKKWGKIFND